MDRVKENIKFYTVSFFILANFFIWYAVFFEQRKDLTVAFLDVGQGDAIFIESPDGKQILIDGGSNESVVRELSKLMPFYDRSIDMVLMSHPDSDHIGGLPAVLKNYQVDFFIESGVSSGNGVYDELEKVVLEKGVKKFLAQQGMKVYLCDFDAQHSSENSVEEEFLKGCENYLEILFPNVDVSGFETNTASIVVRLVYGNESFLFTGDSPQKIENYLAMVYGNKLKVNVLKLGHHGSSTSNSEKFLGFTSPEYAIVSVGLNNRYGHPHQEVINLLNKFTIPLLRTDQLGTIIFKTDGQSLKINKKPAL